MYFIIRMFKKLIIAAGFLTALFYFTSFRPLLAQTNEEIEKELAQIAEALRLLEIAEKPLKEELSQLRVKLTDIEKRINNVSLSIDRLEESIKERSQDLAYQKMLFNQRVRNQYIKQRSSSSPLLLFLSTDEAIDLTQEVWANRMVARRDQEELIEIAQNLLALQKDKEFLEKEKVNLAAVKKTFASRAQFLEGEIKEAESYRAQLNARQKELIAKKLASLNLPTSLGAGPLYCVDDRIIDPGFRPAFAFFTFGIPHRVGMNQYGALGRAQAGQSSDQILRAYYNFDNYEDRSGVTIKVNNGNGVNQGGVIWTGSLEDYVKRIYEVPASWPMAALEAQAIAARSYALAVTNNGANSICANQYCQVFKTDPKGGDWEKAVNNTSGKAMVAGGQVITAWYASTAGGYTYRSSDVGWQDRPWTKRMQDTTSAANGFGELMERAYDKESPCFYAAQGWRGEYNRSAWLKAEEVADIVNAILLAKADSGSQDHLYQPDKPHPYGGEVWDQERVKQELRQRGITPFNRIDNASVNGVDWGVGKTTSISFSGDGGSVSFSGDEFKDYFNLRAPANIQIVGPLFNVERK